MADRKIISLASPCIKHHVISLFANFLNNKILRYFFIEHILSTYYCEFQDSTSKSEQEKRRLILEHLKSSQSVSAPKWDNWRAQGSQEDNKIAP